MARSTAITLRRQFTWLITVLVAVGVLRIVGGEYSLSAYVHDVDGIRNAQQVNQAILQVLTDAETGIRGYQLTGRPEFLDPYRTGVIEYATYLREAREDAGPALRPLIDAQDVVAQQWLTGFASPIAEVPPARAARNVAASARDAAQTSRGKLLFDEIRTSNNAVAAQLLREEHTAAKKFRDDNRLLQGLLVLLTVASVLIGLLVATRTGRLLLVPLGHLQTVLDRLGAGDRTARANITGPPEVAALAAALNASLDATDHAEANLRAAHDTVEHQRGFYAQILDTLNLAIMTSDVHGNLDYISPVARQGRPGQSLHHVDDLIGLHDADDPRHPVARALAGETLTRHEMTLRLSGQPDRALMVDARPLLRPDGTIVGAVASSYDVTILREREAELSAFAGIVAHDLNSPLAAVLGYTQEILDDLNTGTPGAVAHVRVTLELIVSHMARMGRLIDDLLAYATARDKPLRPEPVDLNEMITEIAANRSHRAGARDADAFAPVIRTSPLPTVPADPGLLRQLLDNVIGNAIKYTRPGEAARVHIWATSADASVHLHIDDRGIGIPADQRANIFTAFHRAPTETPYAGTGLGLAICERVTTRHGGSISATENPDGGTRITITLPMTPRGPAAEALPGPARH